MQVKDIMQTRVITTQPQMTLREAARKMLEYGVNGLPVLDDDGHVIGIIGLKDILRVPNPSLFQSQVNRSSSLEEKVEHLDNLTVERVMARRVVSVTEDDAVMAAIAVMVNLGLHPVPVVRESKLIGVVSRADAVRAMLAVPIAPGQS